MCVCVRESVSLCVCVSYLLHLFVHRSDETSDEKVEDEEAADDKEADEEQVHGEISLEHLLRINLNTDTHV